MEKRVFLAGCKDYEQKKVDNAIHASLEAFGGAKALAGGKRVLIKANLLMSEIPSKAVTTHPAVVSALAREFMSAGCTVEIADSCGGLYNEGVLRKLYSTSGMKRVSEETGAELNFDTSSFEREIPNGVKIKKTQMITPIERAEFIISAAKLKTHGFTYYTGAAKNIFGVIPGLSKAAMHSKFPDKTDFCEMLVDLCESVKPDLSIIDGVVGMEGAGPSGGTPKEAGVIITSKSPYAADLAAMDIMGLDAEKSPLHMAAKGRGLIDDIELFGDNIENFRTSFTPAYTKDSKSVLSILPGALKRYVEKFFARYPYIRKEKCIGCGECVRSCPEHTIKLREKKAVIDYKNCIRCYCCQEMCPARAIDIVKFAKHRKK
ncbi:MAG: DUF362 domain-containing protein [Oscillospiraceae bacterium]|nr:DUF362 domain-containing protein [Oscillospiraceae bacterium]